MDYLTVKWLHVLSSTLLFGTGLGSAFYMFFTNRTRDTRAIAVVRSAQLVALLGRSTCAQPPSAWARARSVGRDQR